MRAMVGSKLAAVRAALAAEPKHAKLARARALADDAAFNTGFVELGRGVHNVFYAADLLKLSNGWLDDALGLLGKPAVETDDTLVRGGYCAVLCHEQAGVTQPPVVTFGTRRIPHVRHVTEFGAVCTACHSAEVHTAVTATSATCSGCHHSPRNERCETCHRPQSAFYRGTTATGLVTLAPNVMANAVGCTGCHDFSRKHSRAAVGRTCVGCHDAAYASFHDEWTAGLDKVTAEVAAVVERARAAVARPRAGRPPGEAAALVKTAREALAAVRQARGAHNPPAAEALLEAARKKAEEALALSRP
jgi:hypothetical protein